MCDLMWYNTVYIYTYYLYNRHICTYIYVCVCACACVCVCVRVRASLKWCVSGTTSLFHRDHDHQPLDFLRDKSILLTILSRNQHPMSSFAIGGYYPVN